MRRLNDIEHRLFITIVNGKVTFDKGEATGARPGLFASPMAPELKMAAE